MPIFSGKTITRQIQRFGEEVTIYQKSEGNADDYGDPAPTWTALTDSEKVIFDRKTGLADVQIMPSEAGRMTEVNMVAYAKNDTSITTGDYIESDDEKWLVLFREGLRMADTLIYYILYLKEFD